jgi:hypothetical protein
VPLSPLPSDTVTVRVNCVVAPAVGAVQVEEPAVIELIVPWG